MAKTQSQVTCLLSFNWTTWSALYYTCLLSSNQIKSIVLSIGLYIILFKQDQTFTRIFCLHHNIWYIDITMPSSTEERVANVMLNMIQEGKEENKPGTSGANNNSNFTPTTADNSDDEGDVSEEEQEGVTPRIRLDDHVILQLAHETTTYFFDLADALGFDSEDSTAIFRMTRRSEKPDTYMVLTTWLDHRATDDFINQLAVALRSIGRPDLANGISSLGEHDESGDDDEEEVKVLVENGEKNAAPSKGKAKSWDEDGQSSENGEPGKEEEEVNAGDKDDAPIAPTKGKAKRTTPLIRQCPLCSKTFQEHLSGHLIRTHKLTNKANRNSVLSETRYRARSHEEEKEKRIRKDCPFKDTCGLKAVKRLDKHLQGPPHSIKPNSAEYRQLCKQPESDTTSPKKKKNPSTPDAAILEEFKQELIGRGGTPKSACQRQKEVSFFLNACCGHQVPRVKAIYIVDNITAAVKRLRMTANFQAATLQHYLHSVVKFLEFVHSMPNRLYPRIGGAARKGRYHEVRAAIRRELQMLQKEVKIRVRERRSTIRDEMISPTTEQFYRSCIAERMAVILSNLQRGQQLGATDTNLLRNNIIVELLMLNGHRASVLCNMTLKEFHDGEWFDGMYVVTVLDHKTIGSHDAAHLVCDRKTHKLIERYYDQARPNRPCDMGDSSAMFILSTGNRLNLATELRRHWFAATGQRRRVSAAMFRKGAATAARRVLEDNEFHLVNSHMCHNPETARQDYVAANSRREAVKAALSIRRSKELVLREDNEDQEEDKQSPIVDNVIPASPNQDSDHETNQDYVSPPTPPGQVQPGNDQNQDDVSPQIPPGQVQPVNDQNQDDVSPQMPPGQVQPGNYQNQDDADLDEKLDIILNTQKRQSKRFPKHVMKRIFRIFRDGLKERYINKKQGYLVYMAYREKLPEFNSSKTNKEDRDAELKTLWQSVYDKLREVIKELKGLDNE